MMGVFLRLREQPVEHHPAVAEAVDLLVRHLQDDPGAASTVVADLATRLGVLGVAIDPSTSEQERVAGLVKVLVEAINDAGAGHVALKYRAIHQLIGGIGLAGRVEDPAEYDVIADNINDLYDLDAPF